VKLKKNSLLIISIFIYSIISFNLYAKSEWDAKPFDGSLNTTRGTISSKYENGFYFENKEACRWATTQWGWLKPNCKAIDAFIINYAPNVDTTVISIPNNDGFVKYDDWYEDDKKSNIDKIWTKLKKMYALQAERMDKKIEVVRWLVYPTLIEEKNYIFYAFLLKIDGKEVPQIVASILDRYGYIEFKIVPRNLTSSSSAIEYKTAMISALEIYKPNQSNSYDDYVKGDKVSEYGIFGVLAALAGIKWGKAVATGIIATFLIFVKKFWWIVLLSFYFIIRKIFKKNK